MSAKPPNRETTAEKKISNDQRRQLVKAPYRAPQLKVWGSFTDPRLTGQASHTTC